MTHPAAYHTTCSVDEVTVKLTGEEAKVLFNILDAPVIDRFQLTYAENMLLNDLRNAVREATKGVA